MKIALHFLLLCFSINAFCQQRLVKVNDQHFNVNTKGFENRKAATPVLVFENGMGVGLGNWDTIFDELSKSAPVFTYDRANVEKSDKDYQLPTTKRVADNLRGILKALKIKPPYVLVGHSMGGLYARAFAGYYPTDVAGLVFIDPADFTETKQDWNQIFRTIGVPEKRIDEMIHNRLYTPSKVDSLYYGIWSESQILSELRRTDFSEIKKLPLPDVPIYFFMGGKFEVPLERRSKDYDHESFFTERTHVNIERWRRFIYSSDKGGSLIYLSKSGHFVHRDDPKAVIANMKLLLDELKE